MPVEGGDEHDARHVLRARERLGDSHAVEIRHLHVEEDEIGPLRGDLRERFFPGARFADDLDAAGVAQKPRQLPPRRRLVVSENDAHYAGVDAVYGKRSVTCVPPSGASAIAKLAPPS